MQTTAEHISLLQSKTAKLIRAFEDARQSVETEKQKGVSLKRQLEDLQHELNQAKQRELLYKAALNELPPKDKKELEKKISDYIKTIDRAVARLGHDADE